MGRMGRSGSSDGRRYSPREKEQAVRMVRALREELGTSQGTVKRVAEQLGYGVESVRVWVKQADVNAGVAPGPTSVDKTRIVELEREVR
jgi:transposase